MADQKDKKKVAFANMNPTMSESRGYIRKGENQEVAMLLYSCGRETCMLTMAFPVPLYCEKVGWAEPYGARRDSRYPGNVVASFGSWKGRDKEYVRMQWRHEA